MALSRGLRILCVAFIFCYWNRVTIVKATCLFNPCTLVDDFCLNSGVCSLVETTCEAICKCEPGFNGNRCQIELQENLLNSTTNPSPSTSTTGRGAETSIGCAFNPCLVPGYCENNGSCSLNTVSCSAQCKCSNRHTGSRCQINVDDGSDSDARTEIASFCTFNPCIGMSNFCFNNGTCLIDNRTCVATCTCPHTYFGNRCEQHLNIDSESTESSTTVKPRVCAFDTCAWSADYCKNDGVCKLDTSTCLAYCTCSVGFTGSRCEKDLGTNPTPVVTTTTGERICAFDVCTWSQSYCDNNGTCYLDKTTCMAKCDCHNGFTGKRCENIFTSRVETTTSNTTEQDNGTSKCNINMCTLTFTNYCFNGGECKFDDNSCEASCECKESYTGGRCEIEDDVTGEPGGNETVTEMPVDQSYNVCRAGALERTENERICNPAFQCVYGVCRVTFESDDRLSGYKFKCKCDPGAEGTFCEEKCCLDCGPHGKCRKYKNLNTLKEGCNCRHRYQGEFCDIYVPEPVRVEYTENTWYLWVVGLCVGTFVILLLLAVIVPYWMWTHRVILIMKIVHYFQAYEDEDDKYYDAFISYKADEVDERFVVQVLYPKLEKEMGFKLCLHFRDFVPGETISNNIINAVEGSRRTILVLSPRYIKSEFTRFEYQKAQEEMLKRKHRIIPIVLEDITECKQTMDKNLKGIIGSVTYLEWPNVDSENKNEKFWKRLQLSMPKKKVLENIASEKSFGSGYTDSTHVSGNIYSSGYDVDNHNNVYSEIGEIDDNLSPTIRPMSETEELALSHISHTVVDTNHSDDESINDLKSSHSNFRNNLMIGLDDLKFDLMEDIKANEQFTIGLKDGDSEYNPSEYIV